MKRYADYAYAHAKTREDDPKRGERIDKKARAAGFINTPDYLDSVMSHPETKSFEGFGNRTFWMNEKEKLWGVNNKENIENTTVVDKTKEDGVIRSYENHKRSESKRLEIQKEELKSGGPLSHEQRHISDHNQERENNKNTSSTPGKEKKREQDRKRLSGGDLRKQEREAQGRGRTGRAGRAGRTKGRGDREIE